MRTQRQKPGIDIDQLDANDIHGGLNAPQLQGFGGGLTKPGDPAVFDNNGAVIAGRGNTHAEILTDGLGNPILAAGDFIYVLSVPN